MNGDTVRRANSSFVKAKAEYSDDQYDQYEEVNIGIFNACVKSTQFY